MTRRLARTWRFLLIPSILYLTILCVLSVSAIASWPIIAFDTDLWYHLTSGRYFFQHGAPPHTSFFSFLSPSRGWVDYFWLFQVVVYLVHSCAQYYGLVALRALLFLAILVMVAAFFLKNPDGKLSYPWLVFLAITVYLVLLPRMVALRPHLVTYLFIPIFLYILEYHPRRAMWLPVLTVLWCNLHGIIYPLMLFICYAYALEDLVYRYARHSPPRFRGGWPLIVPALLSTVAVLLTPHGVHLIKMPFVSTAAASRYILELRPLTLFETLSLEVFAMAPTTQTFFNILLLVICGAGCLSLAKRPFRISHLVLALGGALLLTKGFRFKHEFTLLALPLLHANPLFPSSTLSPRTSKLVYLVGSGLLMLFPVRLLVSTFADRPAYPLSPQGLPVGVTAFLDRMNVGGTILNFPNDGGYLQWKLYPRYTIFLDMEVPYMFTDDDLYFGLNMFSDDAIFAEAISRYHPTFLIVPNVVKEFPKRIERFPDYTLVYCDDVEVLYVDHRQQPALARRYVINALDPFALASDGVEPFLKKVSDRQAIMREARWLLGVYPGLHFANHIVAQTYNEDGAYDRALPFAMAMVRNFPISPYGYGLLGEAWQGLHAFDRAVASYQRSIELSGPDRHPQLYQQIGNAFVGAHQYERAYKAFDVGVDPFSSKSTIEELYQLWSAARLAGRTKQAQVLLQYLQLRVPHDDPVWAQRLHDELGKLQAAGGHETVQRQ